MKLYMANSYLISLITTTVTRRPMLKRLYNSFKEWLFPVKIKPTESKITPMHQLNDALKKFQESVDEVSSLLLEQLNSWERTFQVEIKHTRRTYKFDLSNPSTREDVRRKRKHARELTDLLLKRWLLKKAQCPLVRSQDQSFDEIVLYFRGAQAPDNNRLEMPTGKSYQVEIPKEQLEAWARLREIYFPKEHDEKNS